MSIRAAFGLGATIGFVTAALLGAPLAPALIYGLLAGTVFAAIAATPPAQHGIAVVRRRPLFGWSLGSSPWFSRGPRVAHAHGPAPVHHGVAGVGVHARSTVASRAAPAPASRSWLPSFSFASAPSTTSVGVAPSGRSFAATTTASGAFGGTRHSSAAAVPGHASNVSVTRRML